MKRAFVAAIGVAAFMSVGATGALAGEVKGPPGVPCGARLSRFAVSRRS